MAEILFISENKIKEKSIIQLNVESKILLISIIDTQNIYLRPILGNILFNNLKDYIQNKTDDNKNELFDTLIEGYIQPYLANSVLIHLITNLQFRVSNKGLIKFNDSYSSTLSNSDTEYWKGSINSNIASYKSQTIDFLKENNLLDKVADVNINIDSIGWYLES